VRNVEKNPLKGEKFPLGKALKVKGKKLKGKTFPNRFQRETFPTFKGTQIKLRKPQKENGTPFPGGNEIPL